MGHFHNEPNTNLTGVRSAIRSPCTASDSSGTCRALATAPDVFGHDPQFPGMASDAGLTSSGGAGAALSVGPMAWRHPRRMQFRSEFEDRAVRVRPADFIYMLAHLRRRLLG